MYKPHNAYSLMSNTSFSTADEQFASVGLAKQKIELAEGIALTFQSVTICHRLMKDMLINLDK